MAVKHVLQKETLAVKGHKIIDTHPPQSALGQAPLRATALMSQRHTCWVSMFVPGFLRLPTVLQATGTKNIPREEVTPSHQPSDLSSVVSAPVVGGNCITPAGDSVCNCITPARQCMQFSVVVCGEHRENECMFIYLLGFNTSQTFSYPFVSHSSFKQTF